MPIVLMIIRYPNRPERARWALPWSMEKRTLGRKALDLALFLPTIFFAFIFRCVQWMMFRCRPGEGKRTTVHGAGQVNRNLDAHKRLQYNRTIGDGTRQREASVLRAVT